MEVKDLAKLVLDIFRTYDLQHKKNLKLGKQKVMGCVKYDEKYIGIEKALRGAEADKTLLHELAHIYSEEYLGEEWSEEQVDQLAQEWYKSLYDTKD